MPRERYRPGSRYLTEGARRHGFRIGQIGSACMVSLAHGTNDAQKTMGVITLALITNGTLAKGSQAPVWVILCCALAISIGTYSGGLGAAAEYIAHGIGGTLGVVIDLVILVAIAATIYFRSRKGKVDPNNVNEEWTGSVTSPAPEPAAA